MDDSKRSSLLHWLYLTGPIAGAALLVLAAILDVPGLMQRVLPANIATYVPAIAGGSILGWLLLTLGCSVGTCLELYRRQGKCGLILAVYVALTTPVLAMLHMAVIGGVAAAGCAAFMRR
jgi:hypothetical protein